MGQVMQYKEQEDSVSSLDKESSLLEKIAGNLLKVVSPITHK